MPNRIEMFRRLERQYFRDRLGTLGLQQLDGMILHLLGREGHMRQEDLAVQLAVDKGCCGPEPGPSGKARPGGAAGERPVPPGEACLSDFPRGRAHIRASSGFWRSGGMSNTRASPLRSAP